MALSAISVCAIFYYVQKEQIEKKTSNSGGAGGTKRGMTRREKSNSGRPIDKVELTFKKFDTNKVYSFHSTTIWIIKWNYNFFFSI